MESIDHLSDFCTDSLCAKINREALQHIQQPPQPAYHLAQSKVSILSAAPPEDSPHLFLDWVMEWCKMLGKPLPEFPDPSHKHQTKWYYDEDILQFAIQMTCDAGIFSNLCNMIASNEAGTYGFTEKGTLLLIDTIREQRELPYEMLSAAVLLTLTTKVPDFTEQFLSSLSVDLQKEGMKRALSFLGSCYRAGNEELLTQFDQLCRIAHKKRIAFPCFSLSSEELSPIVLLMIDKGVPRLSSPLFKKSLNIKKVIALLKKYYHADNPLRREQFQDLFSLAGEKLCFSAKQPESLFQFINSLPTQMLRQGISEALDSLGRSKKEDFIHQFEHFEHLYTLVDDQQLSSFAKAHPEKANLFLASYLVKAVKSNTMTSHFPFLDYPGVQTQRVLISAIQQLICEYEETPFLPASFQKLLNLLDPNEALPEIQLLIQEGIDSTIENPDICIRLLQDLNKI